MTSTATPSPPSRSLRTRLVRRIVLPLVFTWSLGVAATIAVSSHFVNGAFDRALLDDAHAVAAQVRVDKGEPALQLSQAELSALLFDQSDLVYFAVFDLAGARIAGHTGLLPSPDLEGPGYQLEDTDFHGRSVRTATLRRSAQDPFIVVMAQTTRHRQHVFFYLLASSLAAQLPLLLFLVWWLRRAIRADLRPLADMQTMVERRDANDLSPLPPPLAAAVPTRELSSLGQAINSLLARLAHSLNAQREFTGNVAHELRTPLAGIRAQAEYALASTEPSVWRTQLEGIARSEARASHQVEQLLALARADEAQAMPTLHPLALDELAREAVLRALPRADVLGVDLGATGLEQPVRIMGDPMLIDGVLDNLLDNALRYGRATQPRITLALSQTEGEILLAVSDNGPGLDPHERQAMLMRGARGTRGKALGEGAGLGLAIVSRYAQLLDARFELTDTPGGGLTASLHFRAGAS